MTAPSSVRYARVGSLHLAYQTWGEGPCTLVAVPPMAQNIELTWERPEYRAMFARVGSFARNLHFDKRGTGASDPTAHMPTLDERVEDLLAVLNHAGIERAYLLGVSEGGPVALSFAATYPDRVDGVVLLASGARIFGDETAAERAARRELLDVLIDRWGSDETISLDIFAPSVSADAGYRAWQPRYERQSASPAAMRQLMDMMETIDVRPLLASVTVPVLVLRRRGDMIMPVERAQEAVEGLPDARLVEVDGDDHFTQIGDRDAWLDHVEQFMTGSLTQRPAAVAVEGVRAHIRTMGGFSVCVDGKDVALSAWGSRLARQLCKRLAVAAGQPVPREELTELLWPDEADASKLNARLSVLLSNVRRVLRGGLIADRQAVRLDRATVHVDLLPLYEALSRGDDAAAVAAFRGPVLPEDAYDDWATAAHERLTFAVVGARRRLAAQAAAASRTDDVIEQVSALLELDPYDERAHELLVRTLTQAGCHGDADRAAQRYRDRMTELGVRPQDLLG